MSPLDPEHLLTLLAVAESGSESAAAALLGIGQSSVSRRLAALQQSSAEPLTVRTASGIRPTAAGERLIPHARAIRDALLASHRAIAPEVSRQVSFRFGCSPHVALGIAAQFVAAVLRMRPTPPEAHYLEAPSSELLADLRGGSAVDAAITLDAPAGREPGFTASRLGSDDLVLISARALGTGATPDLDLLRTATLLLPPAGSQVHARGLAALAGAGIHLASTVVASGPAALKAAALAGAGVGITLASCCSSEVAAGWLSSYPLAALGGSAPGSVDFWLLISDLLPARESEVVAACARQAASALTSRVEP